MRRLASDILRSLEMRVARLESQASTEKEAVEWGSFKHPIYTMFNRGEAKRRIQSTKTKFCSTNNINTDKVPQEFLEELKKKNFGFDLNAGKLRIHVLAHLDINTILSNSSVSMGSSTKVITNLSATGLNNDYKKRTAQLKRIAKKYDLTVSEFDYGQAQRLNRPIFDTYSEGTHYISL